MPYVNIHCHMVYGIDDGAKTPQITEDMLAASYESGVRAICMTPHYNPANFKYPLEAAVRHYKKAKAYAERMYPDLKICLGHEIFFYHDTVDDILQGKCLTLNKTKHILVEFSPIEGRSAIMANMSKLLTGGFIPVIAHVERYDSLKRRKGSVEELKKQGVYIQINAASVLGKYGFSTKRYVMSLIKQGLVDIVADDCHNMTDKAPCLGEAYEVIRRKFGKTAADMLCTVNPGKVLGL